MKTNGGFLVTKIKQLGDRIFEKILSEKNIDAFNGAQGRILYVLWQDVYKRQTLSLPSRPYKSLKQDTKASLWIGRRKALQQAMTFSIPPVQT